MSLGVQLVQSKYSCSGGTLSSCSFFLSGTAKSQREAQVDKYGMNHFLFDNTGTTNYLPLVEASDLVLC